MLLSRCQEGCPNVRQRGDDSPGWGVLDDFPVDALGLASPFPWSSCFGTQHRLWGGDMGAGEAPPAPAALYFSRVGAGGCFEGVVFPCQASTHWEICLIGTRKPNGAIKYYLDATRSHLTLSSSREMLGGQRGVRGRAAARLGCREEGCFVTAGYLQDKGTGSRVGCCCGFLQREDAGGPWGAAGSRAAAPPLRRQLRVKTELLG